MLPSFALFSLLTFAGADFSPSFNAFLAGTYGKAFADRMARRDIGGHGSFGGGDHQEGFRTSRQAVILVHGITNTAGRFEHTRQHLLKNGWKESEVYATTYGDGGKTPAPLVDMKCDYVKQVRWLIQAVAEFTKRRVDVIGYSMGSPVARKAILGGRCVDTGEALGPRLTALTDTFVSVAGANHGSFLCLVPFPGACNLINGLSCHSQFILNINKRQRYEGLHIYSIYSPQDDKVGHRNACGELTSSIAGSDQEFQDGRSRLYIKMYPQYVCVCLTTGDNTSNSVPHILPKQTIGLSKKLLTLKENPATMMLLWQVPFICRPTSLTSTHLEKIQIKKLS